MRPSPHRKVVGREGGARVALAEQRPQQAIWRQGQLWLAAPAAAPHLQAAAQHIGLALLPGRGAAAGVAALGGWSCKASSAKVQGRPCCCSHRLAAPLHAASPRAAAQP